MLMSGSTRYFNLLQVNETQQASGIPTKIRMTVVTHANLKVILPNIKPALLTGIVMAFAHTVGEFGVVLMIGGGIPGETRVASIAIFGEVEALNYATANFYSGVLFLISFVILFVLNAVIELPPIDLRTTNRICSFRERRSRY